MDVTIVSLTYMLLNIIALAGFLAYHLNWRTLENKGKESGI